jgi:hypothetical protein
VFRRPPSRCNQARWVAHPTTRGTCSVNSCQVGGPAGSDINTKIYEFGWEAGILFAYFKKPNKHGLFSRKPRRASNLAFSSSFVGVRLFTSVFVFCQRNDTRNDTRRETLLRESSTSIWKATLKDLPFAQPIFGELGFQSAPQASASTRSAMHSQESKADGSVGIGFNERAVRAAHFGRLCPQLNHKH